MPIRPRDLVDRTRPDNTQYVSQVERSNGISSFTAQEGEELLFFSRFFDERSAEFPWAGQPLDPGERVFLRDTSAGAVEDGTVGRPLSFSNPLIIEEGFDFEVVQDYVDARGNLDVTLWGPKPSAVPPYDSEQQFEPLAPLYYDGATGAFSIQRVAEPTERSLLNPSLDGETAIAATAKNVSSNPDPVRGKIYISCVLRDKRGEL